MAKVKKRADTRYQKCFRYNGKRYTVYGKTPTEAEQAKITKIAELESGVVDRANPKLNDYYQYFTENRRGSVKESTIRGQSNQFKKCAAVVIYNHTTFGEMRMRDIKARDLQAVQKALIQAGNSTCTVNDNMAHLSHVFNAALRDETIDRNPCISITRVRRTEPLARDTTHRALSPHEVQSFIVAAKDSYFINLFKLMLNTGMRIGEVAALTELDIDRQYIHITKTVTRNENGSNIVGDSPKTRGSVRDIPLTDTIRQILKSQRELNKQVFGNITDLSEPLFRSPEGTLLREYTVNREIKRLLKNTDIEYFSSHAFRETFASMFIDQQPELYKTLSEIMGHSDVGITLNLYAHALPDTKITAMNNLTIAQ